jgi:hypothetical protein
MGARELSGETVPWLVLRRADGWWDVVPQSTAIRAPQVLLWLNDREVGAEEDAVVFLGWTGARPIMTCACSTRTAPCWSPGG